MFGIGTWELVVIFLVALVVLGPRRLPHVARSIGKALRELRNALSAAEDQLRTPTDIPEPDSPSRTDTSIRADPSSPPESPSNKEQPL